MNLQRRAAELKIANRHNKLKVQAKRGQFARTKATLTSLPAPDKFPTRYKYG